MRSGSLPQGRFVSDFDRDWVGEAPAEPVYFLYITVGSAGSSPSRRKRNSPDLSRKSCSHQESRLTEQIVAHLGYVGIALILILGAVLSRNGKLLAPLALATCLLGVLTGDFVVYFLGFFYGEKVLSLRLTRRLLTRAREAQIKGYFHRHGFKILVLGRFAVGFRTAAYLTAGILKLPALKLLLID